MDGNRMVSMLSSVLLCICYRTERLTSSFGYWDSRNWLTSYRLKIVNKVIDNWTHCLRKEPEAKWLNSGEAQGNAAKRFSVPSPAASAQSPLPAGPAGGSL